MQHNPIGVMDSGVGGLTILAEIHRHLPNESTVYVGDSKNAPYGKRSPEEIRLLASKMIQFLVSNHAKLIVIACNTITVNGIDLLRQQFPQVPIVGTVPVIKKGDEVTKKKKIGLLVTEATARSTYNKHLIEQFASDDEVVTIGTNKLVPLIEAEKNSELPDVISTELLPFKEKGVDVIILGSTHFPILRSMIQDFMGEGVTILDSGGAIARQVQRILNNNQIISTQKSFSHSLFTTGEIKPFQQIAQRVLSTTTPVTQIVLK